MWPFWVCVPFVIAGVWTTNKTEKQNCHSNLLFNVSWCLAMLTGGGMAVEVGGAGKRSHRMFCCTLGTGSFVPTGGAGEWGGVAAEWGGVAAEWGGVAASGSCMETAGNKGSIATSPGVSTSGVVA